MRRSIGQRLSDKSWELTVSAWRPFAETRTGRFAADTFFALRAVILGFRGEKISLRAAALTYVSIFSLVPIITVGLGLLQRIRYVPLQATLRNFIHEMLAPGIQEQSSQLLDKFIKTTSSATASTIGIVVLLFSAGSLLRNLDSSLNEIFNVRKTRPFHIRVLIYVGVLVVGPVLTAVSLVLTATVRSAILRSHIPLSHELITLGSALVSIAGFTLLYRFAPNAKVRFRSALAGGLVAGTAWELAKHLYAEFAARMFDFNPVYGSLGAAPLFLIWIYLSWMLVLFGARLAYAIQFALYRGTVSELGNHPRAKELVAARVAQIASAAALGLAKPLTLRELVGALRVQPQIAVEVIDRMLDAGLLVTDSRGLVIPGKSPRDLYLSDVSMAVGGFARFVTRSPEEFSSEFGRLEALYEQADQAGVEHLRRVSWEDLGRHSPIVVAPLEAPEVPAAATGGQNP